MDAKACLRKSASKALARAKRRLLQHLFLVSNAALNPVNNNLDMSSNTDMQSVLSELVSIALSLHIITFNTCIYLESY